MAEAASEDGLRQHNATWAQLSGTRVTKALFERSHQPLLTVQAELIYWQCCPWHGPVVKGPSYDSLILKEAQMHRCFPPRTLRQTKCSPNFPQKHLKKIEAQQRDFHWDTLLLCCFNCASLWDVPSFKCLQDNTVLVRFGYQHAKTLHSHLHSAGISIAMFKLRVCLQHGAFLTVQGSCIDLKD